MGLEIIEKPLFFLGFFNILRKSLEAFGNALGDPLGTPRGVLGDAWGSLGDALGGLGDALEDLGDAVEGLGDALEDLLGKPSLEDPPRRSWDVAVREAP
jgi:hypothetical protein